MKAILGKWTTRKAAAIAGALAIGGAVGSAFAIGPSVPAPVKWQGGWEYNIASAANPTRIYTVPAGRNLLLTDLVLGNQGSSSVYFSLYTGLNETCLGGSSAVRMQRIIVPAGGSTVVDLTTGVGFGSGQVVCFEAQNLVSVNMRGFLFTAAPVS